MDVCDHTSDELRALEADLRWRLGAADRELERLRSGIVDLATTWERGLAYFDSAEAARWSWAVSALRALLVGDSKAASVLRALLVGDWKAAP